MRKEKNYGSFHAFNDLRKLQGVVPAPFIRHAARPSRMNLPFLAKMRDPGNEVDVIGG